MFIDNTSSQNCVDGGHWAVGKYAIGNLNPPSLRNVNWRMCVVICAACEPTIYNNKQLLMDFYMSSNLYLYLPQYVSVSISFASS